MPKPLQPNRLLKKLHRKAESKRIASTAKRDFENKIRRAWDTPVGSSGQKATARVTLSDSGSVVSVVVSASDPDMKASVEAAVRAAAPYPCLQIRMHAVKHEVLLQPLQLINKKQP